MNKNVVPIDEVLEIIISLKEAWEEAVKNVLLEGNEQHKSPKRSQINIVM